MRTKNVIRNSMWSVVSQITNIMLGFIGRTVYIKMLNVQYLGLNGLLTNIISLLSLAELGFSVAVSYNLYKPLAEKRYDDIAAIMNYYKKIYTYIAIVVAIIGMSIFPFLKYIVKDSDFSIFYIQGAYLLFLMNTIASYFLAYRFTLITADQQNYVLINIDIVMRFIMTTINIIVLIATRNYLIYLGQVLFVNILGNIYKSIVVTRKYPYLKQKNKISKEAEVKLKEDVKNIFASKVSQVIVTSTDNIVVSKFINMASVGLMSNYTMLIGYIQTFMNQLSTATQASIGNLIATDGNTENSYIVLKRLTFITFIISSFASVALFNMLNPFIKIWIGQSYLLGLFVVMTFVLNFYVQSIRGPIWQTMAGVRLFQYDKNISILGAVSNLGTSIILVQFLGIAGVIGGTIISFVLQLILKINVLFKHYFKRSRSEYYWIMIKYILILFANGAITFGICYVATVQNLILNIIIKLLICIVVPNVINILIFYKTEEFKYAYNIFFRLVKRKV